MGCSKISTPHVILCLLSLLSLCHTVRSALRSFRCPNTTTYTLNSTYRANLNTLLSSLSSSNDSYATGFYNTTAGSGPQNTVYGLFLCRGDIAADRCRDCVTTATTNILQQCPRESVAVVWYDDCMIRYSDQYIFATGDQSLRSILRNIGNVTELERFKQVFGNVMNDIAARASTSQSGKKFATGDANFTVLQRLYGLAQCTPDLSNSVCNACLRDAISNFPGCCERSVGAHILFPSCNVRYELYPFYQPEAPPPSPAPALPPPPPPSPPVAGKNGVSSTVIIAIVVPIVVVVVLFIIGFFCVIKRGRKQYKTVEGETGKTGQKPEKENRERERA